ncbi:hypothetical protein QFC19_001032 [Naganishia cerealis]|uniref:Uncharacterized protein n=1 Tax=Naganishia cerealis TaxID=610337 RepID=A0ACC2WJM5_9TREE|nr:hypothetical protein QFC19_001032 [Naganishia cerealis]
MNGIKPSLAGDRDFEKNHEVDVQVKEGSVEEPAIAAFEIDPEIERRVKRKIDLVVLPIFGFIFMFQYLDKIALSYAVIFGMKTDLNLQGQDYSWCNSIFCKLGILKVRFQRPQALMKSGCHVDFGQFFFEYFAVYLLHVSEYVIEGSIPMVTSYTSFSIALSYQEICWIHHSGMGDCHDVSCGNQELYRVDDWPFLRMSKHRMLRTSRP